MIFLSVQPDEYYFKWQLELQICNFNKLAVSPGQIHILIGYNPRVGLSPDFTRLISHNKDKACFFVYPDDRQTPEYKPSIRPHLIAKHLTQFPALERETIFYHDSDIVFNQLPDFGQLTTGQDWYVSDTRDYLDSHYIRQHGNEDLFKEMCNIVDISSDVVEFGDEHCGGSQYVLKSTTVAFWKKVEKDAEALYRVMEAHNRKAAEKEYITSGRRRSQFHGIQSWCADMWSLLWNALRDGFVVRISHELDFCWANDPRKRLDTCKIHHYTGNMTSNGDFFFKKTKYINYSPYYDPGLNVINEDCASSLLLPLITQVRNQRAMERSDLSDVSFLIPVCIDSEDRLENLMYLTRYLDKYFNTNILIFETGSERKVSIETLPVSCCYRFFSSEDESFFHTKVNNLLIREAKTTIIAIHDTDIIFPIEQILKSVELIRTEGYQAVYPYDGRFTTVDRLLKAMFGKILSPALLTENAGKFAIGTHRSFGGGVFATSLQQFNDYLVNGYYKSRKSLLKKDVSAIQNMDSALQRQMLLAEKDQDLSGKTMEMNAVLLKDTIISAEEYRQAQSKDYNKKMSIPQLTSSILENQIQKRDKVKEIEELDHEAEKQFISFQQALQTLRSNVENWIRQYVLKSAVEGTVYFMLPLQQNQFIQQGKILGYINPSNDKFFVELFLPQNNLGKVDTGMEVQLRFDAYPYHECGFVTGKLSYISSVVSDSGYLSIVELDKGLKTNFNRELQYKYGLKADAMIITKRTNLMKRIYYGLLEKKQ